MFVWIILSERLRELSYSPEKANPQNSFTNYFLGVQKRLVKFWEYLEIVPYTTVTVLVNKTDSMFGAANNV